MSTFINHHKTKRFPKFGSTKYILTRWEDEGKITIELNRADEYRFKDTMKASNCLGWKYLNDNEKPAKAYAKIVPIINGLLAEVTPAFLKIIKNKEQVLYEALTHRIENRDELLKERF